MEISHPKAWVVILGVLILAAATIIAAWLNSHAGSDGKDFETELDLRRTQTSFAATETAFAVRNSEFSPTAQVMIITATPEPRLATATAQVVVVTATSGPQVVTATSVPQAVVVTSPPTPAPQVVVVTATRPSQSGAGTIATPAISPTPSFCPPAKDQTFFEPTTITITRLAIVHPWWNNDRPSWGQEQVRVLLRSGERLSFIEMLGKVYIYENIEACDRIMDREFANANFPIKTAQDLIAEGVATQQ